MKDTEQIIQNEREMKDLFRKNYSGIFPEYSFYKEEAMVRYEKSHGFIDIILKHRDKNIFLLLEFKFNMTNADAIGQINKYHNYFINNYKSDLEKVEKYIVDFDIGTDMEELCQKNNISCLRLKELPSFKNYEFKKVQTKEALSKIKLTISVNEGILAEFKILCEEEGWKIGKQVEKYMRYMLRNR